LCVCVCVCVCMCENYERGRKIIDNKILMNIFKVLHTHTHTHIPYEQAQFYVRIVEILDRLPPSQSQGQSYLAQ
jgi:hypothetical protein